MIPKVVRSRDGKGSGGTGFKGAVEYVTTKADHVVLRHIAGDMTTAAREMRAVASESTRLQRPVYHLILSWAELENPTNEQMVEAADAALRGLGLESHQAVIAVHRDRDHQHVHVVVNKRGLDGHAADLRGDFARLERVCREVEARQGWSQDRGRFDVRLAEDGKVELVPKAATAAEKPRKLSRGERERERRTGQPPLRERLEPRKAELAHAFQAGSWAELHRRLAVLGLEYRTKGSGAALVELADPEQQASPSHIDKAWSLKALERRFGPYVAATAENLAVERPSAEKPPRRHDPGRERLWRAFQAERADAYRRATAARQADRDGLWSRHQGERTGLAESQRSRRKTLDALFGRRGAVRFVFRLWDKLRSAKEWRELRERQDRERAELRQRAKAAAAPAPDFRRWVSARVSLGDADAVRIAGTLKTGRGDQRTEADHTAARQGWMTAVAVELPDALRAVGITRATVAAYGDGQVKQDRRGGVLFAHRDQADNLVGFEVVSPHWTGFGKGGQRALARFGTSEARRRPARIVVMAGGLEALALAQRENRRDTLYLSTGGSVTKRAAAELAVLARQHPGAVVVLAFGRGDADAEKARQAIGRGERLEPPGRSWTEGLAPQPSQKPQEQRQSRGYSM